MTNSKFKILVVDNDSTTLEKTTVLLLKEGYEVYGTANSEETIALIKRHHPHVIITELTMQKVDGIDICIELRKEKELADISIIIYTNRNDDYSQIASFNAGADDYILKTTKDRVFTTRIKALLKTLNNNVTTNNNKVIVFKELIINNESFFVLKKGEKIILPRREFELLMIMANDPKKIFTRKEISEKVWGNEILPGNRTIDVHIRHLRQKLGDQYIKTVKGYGYGLH